MSREGYLGGLSRVARYAYYFENWHLLVMAAGAFGLLHHYPASYDEWLIQKANEEKSNPLFRNAASGMVLIFSFILHLNKTPYGYTDSAVLYIYRAVSIGLIILTLLINRMAVYFINRKKCYDYYGVDARFANRVAYVYIFSFIASQLMIIRVLPWLVF